MGQEESGPEAERRPPPDHAPVRAADFEGNLPPTPGLSPRAASCRGPERRGPARRGAVVYVFLGRQADRGPVFAEGAQRWWLQVAAAASASVVSAARAGSRDR